MLEFNLPTNAINWIFINCPQCLVLHCLCPSSGEKRNCIDYNRIAIIEQERTDERVVQVGEEKKKWRKCTGDNNASIACHFHQVAYSDRGRNENSEQFGCPETGSKSDWSSQPKEPPTISGMSSYFLHFRRHRYHHLWIPDSFRYILSL